MRNTTTSVFLLPSSPILCIYTCHIMVIMALTFFIIINIFHYNLFHYNLMLKCLWFCYIHYLQNDHFNHVLMFYVFSSVQFSHSVTSESLRLHEPQHARPPCPSPAPRVYPNSCPLSRWCHPAISSSVVPFSSCPLSFPASGSFQMSQLFASGGQSIVIKTNQSY